MVDVWDGPPREGTRGGLEQFKWDSVKGETMRDRECYLGQSVRIGVQGKFGRFNTHDWWRKERGDKGRSTIENEVTLVKRFEEELMQEALGVKPKRFLLLQNKGPVSPEEMKKLFEEDAEQQRASEAPSEPEKKSKKKRKKERDSESKHSRKKSKKDARVEQQRSQSCDSTYEQGKGTNPTELLRHSQSTRHRSREERPRERRPSNERERSLSPRHGDCQSASSKYRRIGRGDGSGRYD
eukprot:GHVN01098516.1.p1 GENE.GHVN01098516.1~~GHVN01098516.1.p1  ORF type:complete len:239 (-),score=33.99 GHVN01098516.1:1175-1891(-)